MKSTIPYDDVAVRLYRNEPALAAEMLNACLEDGDVEELLVALRHITKAFGGIPTVAKAGGLHEKTLYKTLSPKGNPNLKTLVGLAEAMGMRLAFVPVDNHVG